MTYPPKKNLETIYRFFQSLTYVGANNEDIICTSMVKYMIEHIY